MAVKTLDDVVPVRPIPLLWQNAKMARPTPEAMAMDVFATVRKIGYPIEVIYDYSQEMNR